MSPPTSSLPADLRQRIAADLRPVRPVAAPGRRAAWLGLVTAAGVVLAGLQLRGGGDPASAPALVVACGQWVVGLAMVWVALREAVPAQSLGRGRALATLAAGLAAQLGAAVLLATRQGEGWLGEGGLVTGLQCVSGEGLFGLPPLALAVFLLLRAFPLRARLASALAGGAAGLFADAAWHLVCTRTDLAHIVVWHFGSTLLLAAVGYAAGVLAERRLAPRRAGAA